jgi:catechol 2,3-dioxygenase-like lactoylglutathione lyase family enzyme
MTKPLTLTAYNHVGIRVKERARSVAFYELLGFHEVAWHEGPKVSILRNAAGLEINLIVNASEAHDGTNVLMDGKGTKYAGYTHASFRVPAIESTIAALDAAGIAITEGPIELGGVEIAVFVRDPDRNVVELAELLGVRAHES